ncbi:hypothetical protein RFI_09746, partial [Reticulomyxa filosa]
KKKNKITINSGKKKKRYTRKNLTLNAYVRHCAQRLPHKEELQEYLKEPMHVYEKWTKEKTQSGVGGYYWASSAQAKANKSKKMFDNAIGRSHYEMNSGVIKYLISIFLKFCCHSHEDYSQTALQTKHQILHDFSHCFVNARMYHYLLEAFDANKFAFLRAWGRLDSEREYEVTLQEWLSRWMHEMNERPKECIDALFAMGVTPTLECAMQPKWQHFFTPQLRTPYNTQQRLFRLLVISNVPQRHPIVHQYLYDKFVRAFSNDFKESTLEFQLSAWKLDPHSSQPLSERAASAKSRSRSVSDLSPILEHHSELEFEMESGHMEQVALNAVEGSNPVGTNHNNNNNNKTMTTIQDSGETFSLQSTHSCFVQRLVSANSFDGDNNNDDDDDDDDDDDGSGDNDDNEPQQQRWDTYPSEKQHVSVQPLALYEMEKYDAVLYLHVDGVKPSNLTYYDVSSRDDRLPPPPPPPPPPPSTTSSSSSSSTITTTTTTTTATATAT